MTFRFWFPYEEDKLRSMKKRGLSWAVIGKRLKREPAECAAKWSAIRPAQELRHG